MKYLLFIFMSASISCYAAETPKATGTATAEIIEPIIIEAPAERDVLTEELPYVVVYTDEGPTIQVVF